MLKLNPGNHTVKLKKLYSHGVTVESRYMGNVQTLPNGNAFVGWGDVPFMSEFSKSGQLIFDAVLPTPGHHLPRLCPEVGRQAALPAERRSVAHAAVGRPSTPAGTAPHR